jgi:predicted nucleic acid-binding Zn ribbon protein
MEYGEKREVIEKERERKEKNNLDKFFNVDVEIVFMLVL